MTIKIIPLLLFGLLFLLSCSTSSDEQNQEMSAENEHLFSLLENWYLWNQQISPNFDPTNYETNQELLDQIKYSPLDRWSSISNANEFTTYYEEGTYLGYGFSYNWDINNDIRIRFTYTDSPFGDAGIQRGWKLLEIDETPVQLISDWSTAFGEDQIGVTQSFLIEDEDGIETEFRISKDIVTINPVLYSDTLTLGSETIGYLVFNNFINPAREQLDEAFSLFQLADIDKLILDLRYNGGGQVSVASYLANYLIQEENNEQALYKFVHNAERTTNNQVNSLFKQGELDIEELIILTTQSSASASELILNGLKPLMKVTHIGEGPTYGKPVGSYSWFSLDESQVYSLISFEFLNSVDEGAFYDGIEPDYRACDTISEPFGDVSEGLFAAAIDYIETGETSGCEVLSKSYFNPHLPQEDGVPTLILNQ